MDTCNSDIGEYNRCVWSHGANYNVNAKSKSHKNAVQADEVEMEAMSVSTSHDTKQRGSTSNSKEMQKDEISARLGMWLCPWEMYV